MSPADVRQQALDDVVRIAAGEEPPRIAPSLEIVKSGRKR